MNTPTEAHSTTMYDPSAWPKFTRALVEGHTIQQLRTAGGTRPDVRVVEINGLRVLVKDYAGCDRLFKWCIGPILAARERAAMERLRGVPGIPQVYPWRDRYALTMSYFDAQPVRGLPVDTLPAAYYDQLGRLIALMHERGVAHCDLRAANNTLVCADGQPCLVDFAAAVFRGWNPLVNWLFREFVQADTVSVIRIKSRFSPAAMTEADRVLLATPMRYEQTARKIGRFFRNLARTLLTKKRSGTA